MTPNKVNKVVEMIDLPSDCWASIHNIVKDCETDGADLYDSPEDLLGSIEGQLDSLIDEAVDVLSNLREKRAEIIKAVAEKQVVISVIGGVACIAYASEGVEVAIVDFDDAEAEGKSGENKLRYWVGRAKRDEKKPDEDEA